MVRPKNRDTPLTRDEILDCALAMVDEGGLAGLSMRRLAEALGVEAASLYHHLPSKEALLDGILVKVRAEMRIPDPLPTDWKDLMQAIFTEYRRVLALHPNLVPLAGRRVETDPDSGLLFLVQQGFSEEDAVELWQSMIAFTVGFSVFSSSYARSDTFDLPPDLATRMASWREETCARGLRVLLDGFDGRSGSGPWAKRS